MRTPTSLLSAFRPQVQERLYDFYEELRSADDLFWDRRTGAWIATGHAVVSSAAGHPALYGELSSYYRLDPASWG